MTIKELAKSYLQSRYDSGEWADVYASIMADFAQGQRAEMREMAAKVVKKPRLNSGGRQSVLEDIAKEIRDLK